MGFKAKRIPVIWHNNLVYQKYPVTMGRKLYIKKNSVELEKFIYNVWSQIAIIFDEDHHLFFETINEPKLKDFLMNCGMML